VTNKQLKDIFLVKNMGREVRWGIVSTARINRRVAPAIQASPLTQLIGIASRQQSKAERAAQQFGAQKAFGSYETLLTAEDIDAVYISLPNALHAEWIIRAAEAGKHVLCEKPLTANFAEAKRAVRACEKAGVLLMEAFMYRHHPQHTFVKESITNGEIGDLNLITSRFSFFLPPSNDIRWQGTLAGGALMDIGCYCINLSRFLFNSEPTAAHALWHYDATRGVDIATLALLQFPANRFASFTCSMLQPRTQQYEVIGTEGTISVPTAFVPGDSPLVQLRARDGLTERTIHSVDQYTLQIEHFSQCILKGKQLTYPAENGLANMKAIEMVRQAAG
jgi:xylose dehydrogenase (NAD/NADP)